MLAELEEALLEAAVRDEAGAALWRRAFAARDRVAWPEMAAELARAAPGAGGPDGVPLRCVKALLAEPRHAGELHEAVPCEAWGKFLAWFGPLDAALPERVRATLAQPWFHAALDKNEAEALLTGAQEGAFLVRLSATSPGAFTVSKVSKARKINHQRIDYRAERRQFAVQVADPAGGVRELTGADSLEAFINAHARELNLRQPVPCARFRFLFERSASEGYLLPADE